MSVNSLVAQRMHSTIYSKRRVVFVALLLSAVMLVFSFIVIRSTPPPSVVYHLDIIAPLNSEVCPGDVVRYPIVLDVPVDSLPDQITPAESWCLVGGTCKTVKPANMEDDATDSPVLKPRHIETEAKRIVPEYLAPGKYEFWHSTKDAHGNVAAYSVEPITVKACPP